MTAIKGKGPALGMRHMQAFLLFFAIVVTYVGRYNVGMAVVAMTHAETTNPNFQNFNWNEKEISLILSSFFWGYVLTQFLGGALCKRWGAKITMSFCVLGSAILSCITPWSVSRGGWQIFCVIRMLQGLFQGMLFPCLYEHLAKWSPLKERNRLGALSQSGIECGTVLALGISGIIAVGPMGWPGISYVSAIMGFVWCILWWIFAYNNPTEAKFISSAEIEYIESSLERTEDFHKKQIPTPWKAIIWSRPFKALIIVRCSQVWGYSTMQHQIPSYLNGVLNMNLKSNALFSALPFLATWAMSYIFVIIADIIQSRKLMNLSVLRKITNTTASWLPAAGLIAIGFLEDDQKSLAIILMTISVGLNSGSTIGSSLNTIDLSPNHTGILMGIANTLASSMPIFSPLVVGLIVTDTHDRFQWQLVFLITAAIYFIGNLIYIIWGSTDTQVWNAENFLGFKNVGSMSTITIDNMSSKEHKINIALKAS